MVKEKPKKLFDNPTGEIEPTYKPFKHMTKDSEYNRVMQKPNKYCSDRELRIKHDMAADVGDEDNLRHIPMGRAFDHIGKSEYQRVPGQTKAYNDFITKPDS